MTTFSFNSPHGACPACTGLGTKMEFDWVYETAYEGIVPHLERRYRETTSDYWRGELGRYMATRPCPVCGGKRLMPELLAVGVADRSIDQVTAMSVSDLLGWVEVLQGIKEAKRFEGA